MHKRWLAPFLLVSIVTGAAVLRVADLGNRPMHCDEAVHGDKFGELLEDDSYVYDPEEYHGPSLNFLELPIAWSLGLKKLTEVTEAHLRLLPALFGVVLVGLLWPLRDQLGRPAMLCAAAITALSPAMVFYSRYYIQEMLLVCFTLGAVVSLWRYAQAAVSATGNASGGPSSIIRQTLWLVLLGLCLGMMHASKETCVIALAAMAVAASVTVPGLRRLGVKRLVCAGAIVLLSGASVSMLFFSSFLDNPGGIIHSFTTYFVYLGRASGEENVGRHVYPWDYYFRILFWWPSRNGPVWTEIPIAALALVGTVAGALGKGLEQRHIPMVRFGVPWGFYTA